MKIVTEPQWVGIDVSQAKFDIALRPAGSTWQLRNDESGWSELLSQLSTAVIALVVVESTGGMERGVMQVLQQHNIAVAVINPKRARDFRQEFLAPVLIAGSINAVVFETWLVEHLLPRLAPNCLLVLDNARFHRPEQVIEIATAAGHEVLFLPPYSPDLNKIEHDFAALKKIWAYAPAGTTLDEVVANYRCNTA